MDSDAEEVDGFSGYESFMTYSIFILFIIFILGNAQIIIIRESGSESSDKTGTLSPGP